MFLYNIVEQMINTRKMVRKFVSENGGLVFTEIMMNV